VGEAFVDAVVALDDDPTGAQTLTGVTALLAWSPERVAGGLAGRKALHLLTNARALPARDVEPIVTSAAAAATAGAPEAHVLLRGDSTLRGHLREELLGLRAVVDPNGRAPVLLVPALPSAGRVTVGGVHLIVRNGARTPLHETEYARDGVFAYADARLLRWAEERSGGLLPAADGVELALDALRSGGADAVAGTIDDLCVRARPAAFVPDVETVADLEVVAAGYALAAASGARALVRCAPAFVGVVSGTTASEPAPPPVSDGGVLVVCGSYVPTTSRQLARLDAARPGCLVEVDVAALASGDPGAEIARAAGAATGLLAERGLAILATPRERAAATATLEAGNRIATGLAAVVAAIRPLPPVLVAKGGITSHVTLQQGVGADEADVVGPVLPGVSRWSVAGGLDYIVVPGNVGGDDLLVELLDLVTGSAGC
jgi:uncharacterized protein YgbK (DUF1537 family)